jgi:arylsulfatase A-like enzyme
LYDHSVKVPLVFAGPNIPKGKTRGQLVYLQDLVPTIYEMVGIEAPACMEFQSQAAAVKSKRAKGRKSVYATYMNNQRMVRKGDYKLFFIPLAKEVYLFNLKKDPNELNNLSDNPTYDKLMKELAADYLVLAKESGDTFDLASVYPSIFSK